MAKLASLKAEKRLLDRRAADRIRAHILEGVLPAGERLLETQLSAELEVSRGTVRSALAQLANEGLVKQVESDSGKSFELTEAGQSHFDEHQEKLGEPWAGLNDKVGTGMKALRNEMKPLYVAAAQLMQAGSEAGAERGAEVLAEARRKIYAILAEDGVDES